MDSSKLGTSQRTYAIVPFGLTINEMSTDGGRGLEGKS